MNLRRLVLDIDKARARPTLIELARAIAEANGVEAFNLTVTDIDIETVGMDVTIEGNNLDFDNLVKVIEKAGAAVHSVDQLVVGERLVERVVRER